MQRKCQGMHGRAKTGEASSVASPLILPKHEMGKMLEEGSQKECLGGAKRVKKKPASGGVG